MTATLPALTLECSGCGHRWPSRARAGSSIRCPRCRRVRRVPAGRPRTATQARAATATADDDDGLSAAWEAERPPARWHDRLGPEADPCLQCGQPRHWTGAHTALVCLGHDLPLWSVSPGAKTRAAEHLAAIDKSAARKSAQLADPAAERAAAEALESDRAELLDDLDGLAELLDVDGFPRAEPYTAARRAGIRHGAIVELYRNRARKAETLDQLARVADDAENFAASIEGWLDRIDSLRDTLDEHSGRVIPGEVEYDDDDQADARPAPLRPGQRGEMRALMQAARIPEPIARRAAAEQYGPWCSRCSAEQRRGRDGRYFRAVARTECPGRPFEDLCADHLAEAQHQARAAGLTLHIAERYDSPGYQQWAAYDVAARAQAIARTMEARR